MGERPRVLLSAAARRALAAPLESGLGADAIELVALEDVAAGTPVHAAFISRDITGLSSKSQPSPALSACYELLRGSLQLSWVHTHSAGADRPIYAELRARGVAVSTSSGANASVVAQTTLAGVLALAREFPALMAAQRERRWSPLAAVTPPRDLAGQTALLVGWGPIARTLHAWLAMLGLHTIVARHSPQSAADGVETLTLAELPRALPRADWLVLACPLTPDTRALIDAAALARLPYGARVVNVARGEVIVEAALVDALQSGRLAGAFLDVFEQEPLPPDSTLWSLPNVMVTPHSAGHAAGNEARAAAIFVENLLRWRRGEPLRNTVP